MWASLSWKTNPSRSKQPLKQRLQATVLPQCASYVTNHHHHFADYSYSSPTVIPWYIFSIFEYVSQLEDSFKFLLLKHRGIRSAIKDRSEGVLGNCRREKWWKSGKVYFITSSYLLLILLLQFFKTWPRFRPGLKSDSKKLSSPDRWRWYGVIDHLDDPGLLSTDFFRLRYSLYLMERQKLISFEL